MNNAERKKVEMEKMQLAYANYNKGERMGFTRGLSILLFSVMEELNAGQDELMRIWQKVLDIDEALRDEQCSLTLNDINYALLQEVEIVCDTDFYQIAKQMKKTNQETDVDNYKLLVNELLEKYEKNMAERELV